jgi:hypothetical protein
LAIFFTSLIRGVKGAGGWWNCFSINVVFIPGSRGDFQGLWAHKNQEFPLKKDDVFY